LCGCTLIIQRFYFLRRGLAECLPRTYLNELRQCTAFLLRMSSYRTLLDNHQDLADARTEYFQHPHCPTSLAYLVHRKIDRILLLGSLFFQASLFGMPGRLVPGLLWHYTQIVPAWDYWPAKGKSYWHHWQIPGDQYFLKTWHPLRHSPHRHNRVQTRDHLL
jgi:hypothetical protein